MFSVSLMKDEENHKVFDVPSKVVDFTIIFDESEPNSPSSLVILTEEELIVVDMTDDAWNVHLSPYLNPIHVSAVTALIHVDDVTKEVYEKVCQSQSSALEGKAYPTSPWPITGGNLQSQTDRDTFDMLITGHENGSVKFWSCSGTVLSLLTEVKTQNFFIPEEPQISSSDDWPPICSIGCFDPYSDDPSFAIKKLSFCPSTGQLTVGGTAGQVITYGLHDQPSSMKINVIKADLVTEKEGFTWKGHSAPSVLKDNLEFGVGYQPKIFFQISPPASINSLSCNTQWGLVAAGTAHGLVVVDVEAKKTILTKCTLSAQGMERMTINLDHQSLRILFFQTLLTLMTIPCLVESR